MKRNKSVIILILKAILILFLCIIGNMLFPKIEKIFSLRADFSYKKAASYGELTDEVLKNLPHRVHAYLLSTPGDEDRVLVSLLERYQAGSDKFIFSTENPLHNPLLMHKISDSLSDNAITSDSLILYSPDTKKTRILAPNDFVQKSFDDKTQENYVGGIKYEESITEALIYLTTAELPKIQRLVGHDEINDEGVTALKKMLNEKYYELVDVDLTRGDLLESNGVLLILSPRKDLSENDLQSIKNFADNGGNIIISSDYSDPHDLKNFNKLLSLYGVSIVPGIIVSDSEDTASYYQSPVFLLPYMQENEFTSPLIASKRDRLLLAGSRSFQNSNYLNDSVRTAPILKSGKAFVREYSGSDTDLNQRKNEVLSEHILSFFTRRFSPEGIPSHALIIGNSPVLLDKWLYDNTYSVDFIASTLHYFNPDAQNHNIQINAKNIIKAPFIVPNLVLPLGMFFACILTLFVSASLAIIKRKHL